MASIKPRLAFMVDNKLANDGTLMGAELFFSSMDDFNPLNIVKQVPALAQLYEARVRLNDLLAKLDGNDALDHMLNEVIENADTRNALIKELAPPTGEGTPPTGGDTPPAAS